MTIRTDQFSRRAICHRLVIVLTYRPCPTSTTPPKTKPPCSPRSAPGSIDELFAMVPAEMRLKRPLAIPPAMSELELTQHMTALAAKNAHAGQKVCFLGGGSYDHFIPAVVDEIAGRGEFYTSYTPYQAEVSQGNLQVVFEYQTLIARLTGLDVSNASLYDGGSAAAEAVLMAVSSDQALRQGRHGRERASRVSPDDRHVSGEPGRRAGDGRHAERRRAAGRTWPPPSTTRRPASSSSSRTSSAASRTPPHWPRSPTTPARWSSPRSIRSAWACLKRPGDWGADIAVAEGHTLGTPMQYGGPYLGIMACRENLVRRMPGRIAGQTVDRRGKRCFVLTLQTREQHIRREKATSNVCTNQGLFALRATIYLALLGPQGLRETANLCLQKSRYAAEQLCKQRPLRAGVRRADIQRVRHPRSPRPRRRTAWPTPCDAGFLAGVPLGQWYPELDDCFLVAVTEKRTKARNRRAGRDSSSSRATSTNVPIASELRLIDA